MAGGGSFTSDQTTLHRTAATTGVNLRTGRTRVTSIQGAGAASSEVSLYDQTAAVPVAGNLKAKYFMALQKMKLFSKNLEDQFIFQKLLIKERKYFQAFP